MSTLLNLANITVPTLLLEGPEDTLISHTTSLLCSFFCTHSTPETLDACNCLSCRNVKQQQHPFILWLQPEQGYVLSDIDIIFEKIRFSLEPHERFFFILPHAHTLNQATANRLLKVLEEPPHGYFFLLLTNNKNALLSTIQSRAHIHSFHTASTTEQAYIHPLINFFLNPENIHQPLLLDALLKEHKMSEQEAIDLMFELVTHYNHQALHTQSVWHTHAAHLIIEKLKSPPGTASAALFIKNIYLALSCISLL